MRMAGGMVMAVILLMVVLVDVPVSARGMRMNMTLMDVMDAEGVGRIGQARRRTAGECERGRRRQHAKQVDQGNELPGSQPHGSGQADEHSRSRIDPNHVMPISDQA